MSTALLHTSRNFSPRHRGSTLWAKTIRSRRVCGWRSIACRSRIEMLNRTSRRFERDEITASYEGCLHEIEAHTIWAVRVGNRSGDIYCRARAVMPENTEGRSCDRPSSFYSEVLLLLKLMRVVHRTTLVRASFGYRLRSRIISSTSLRNFRDPASRSRVLA